MIEVLMIEVLMIKAVFEDIISNETLGIIAVTMRLTLLSTALSSVLGVPAGLLLWRANFPGKRFVVAINRTLMASPPVVVGLVVFLLLMRRGPFGALGLLFSFEAMVIAQVLIITPIICEWYTHLPCEMPKPFAPLVLLWVPTGGKHKY
jgi:tungstate transport system permease protein